MIDTIMQKETNAEYHADVTHYSHSMLEVFRKSPKLFDKYYITKTLKRPPPSMAMVMGSLLHTLILEPETFGDVFHVAEGCNSRRGKAWQGMVATAEAYGREPVLPGQVESAQSMATAIKEHPLAAKLLAMEGVTEEPIRWEKSNGLLLKCKPDKLVLDTGLDCLLYCEFKSSATPSREKFQWQIRDFGYARQAVHYEDGATAKYSKMVKTVFIVVGNEEPHDVFTYQLKSTRLEEAYRQNAETLADLHDCLQSGKWQAKDQNELITI